MSIDWKIKDLFLDRDAVAKQLEPNQLKFLAKFGAYTRQSMRSSLKFRDGPSAPGRPPNVHQQGLRINRNSKLSAYSPLKDLIVFAVDAASKSVTIGPLPFGKHPGVAPGNLERGGVVPSRKNPKRRLRVVGGAGEIRLGPGPKSRNVPGIGPVAYGRLNTASQAERANKINEALYGPERIAAGVVKPRPFSGPAFQKNIEDMPRIWRLAVG